MVFSATFWKVGVSLLHLFIAAYCDRTSGIIYQDIGGAEGCIRLLNGTHQIGCSSSQKGNVGVVHYIGNEASLDWLLEHGPHKPYIAVMTPSTFNRDFTTRLKDSGKITGILVINSNNSDPLEDGFSPDDACPNRRSSFYAEDEELADCKAVSWNKAGTSMMFDDWPFPIVSLANQTSIDFILNDCYVKYNKPTSYTLAGSPRTYPLCSAQVKDAMDGAKDTATCIRRSNLILNLNPDQYCDPLGDLNIHALSRALSNSDTVDNGSVIIAGTRMDGFSMFDNLYNDSATAMAGIVTMLAAAQLWKTAELPDNHKPVMFTLFQGEAFDYIGSERMAYDMSGGEFPSAMSPNDNGPHPINMHHLHSMLEIGQVAFTESDLYLHADPITTADSVAVKNTVSEMIQDVTDAAGDILTVNDASGPDKPLPPASLQSFLKISKRKSTTGLPGILIADHQEEFKNKFYNSRFDLPSLMDASYPAGMNDTDEMYNYVTPAAARLAKVATVVARSLYKLSTGNQAPESMIANETHLANLLYCYSHSPNCELFHRVITPDDVNVLDKAPRPFPLYVTVHHTQNHVTWISHRVLAYFLGDAVNNITEQQDCKDAAKNDQLYRYIWMAGRVIHDNNSTRENICVKTTANTTIASSPAFNIDGYDWTSGEYSSWTESRWQTDFLLVRVFLVPSKEMEIGVLCGGIALFVLSGITVKLMSSRAALLFPN